MMKERHRGMLASFDSGVTRQASEVFPHYQIMRVYAGSSSGLQFCN